MRRTIRNAMSAIILAFAIILSGCSKKEDSSKSKEPKKQKVDITECVSVSAKGYEGMGVVTCQADSSAIKKHLNQTMKEIYGEEVEEETKKAFSKLESSISFIATPCTELKNGDQVTVSVIYDEKCAKDCKVNFSPESFQYTVSGLEVVQLVDAFEGFKVTFAGLEEEPQIILDNSGCSDFVKNYVVFNVDETSIPVNNEGNPICRNGAEIKVCAEFGTNLPADMSAIYMLTSPSKSFTISGLTMYPTSIDHLDVKEIVRAAKEKGVGFATNYLYNDADYPRFNGSDNFDGDTTEYTGFSIACEKMYFVSPKSNTEGKSGIVLLFHLSYHVKGIRNGTQLWGEYIEADVDTYFAAGSFRFTSDEQQTQLLSTGEPIMIGDSDDEEMLCNNHTLEAGYNALIAPYSENYVVSEMDIAAYADVLSGS